MQNEVKTILESHLNSSIIDMSLEISQDTYSIDTIEVLRTQIRRVHAVDG